MLLTECAFFGIWIIGLYLPSFVALQVKVEIMAAAGTPPLI